MNPTYQKSWDAFIWSEVDQRTEESRKREDENEGREAFGKLLRRILRGIFSLCLTIHLVFIHGFIFPPQILVGIRSVDQNNQEVPT